jgi:hypothetical protein
MNLSTEQVTTIVQNWRELSKTLGAKPTSQKFALAEKAFIYGAIDALRAVGYTEGLTWLEICAASGRSILGSIKAPNEYSPELQV